MAQNTSSAVMQQRIEPNDSFDYYPTQPWAIRALLESIVMRNYASPWHSVLEPACGEGYMTRPLLEYFDNVRAADIQDFGFGEVGDYLFPDFEARTDWTITNPPFKLAEQFILKALAHSRVGIAMFVRTSFVESVGRYERLFQTNPPSHILQFCERVPLFKGRVDGCGSTATSYCWLIWVNHTKTEFTKFDWIPPCRKRLEKPHDYEPPEYFLQAANFGEGAA